MLNKLYRNYSYLHCMISLTTTVEYEQGASGFHKGEPGRLSANIEDYYLT